MLRYLETVEKTNTYRSDLERFATRYCEYVKKMPLRLRHSKYCETYSRLVDRNFHLLNGLVDSYMLSISLGDLFKADNWEDTE